MTSTFNEEFLRLQELRVSVEKAQRAKALREAYGIHFYRPHSKQDKFHSAAHTMGRYCRTGNRGGKTVCGAAEDVAFCLGYRPWYQQAFDVLDGKGNVVRHHAGGEDHPLVTKGIQNYPIKLLIIVTDWDKSKEIFTNNEGDYQYWGALFKLIPRDSVVGVNKSRGGHVDRIDIKRPEKYGGGVSSIYIDTIESFKHAKMSAESSSWDIIHLDEPCPRKMFIAHARGLVDRRGKFWINCTPIDEMWINDEFVPPTQFSVPAAPEGLEFAKSKEGDAISGTRYMITWSIEDNPHNSPEAIAEFAALLTCDEAQCRLHGLPLAMAGLIYKEFIWDLHVLCDIPTDRYGKPWADWNKPPADYTVRIWWDYHTKLPQAVLFVATDPKGRIFVFDELFTDNLIDPVCRQILQRSESYFVAEREIDPFAVIKHPVTQESIVDELCKYGLYFSPATKDLSRGINKVREKLLERDPQGLPTIFFAPHLKQTLYEFTHYVYDVDKNEPRDADNHMMENLYRAVLNGLSYIEPPDESDWVSKPFVIRDGMDLPVSRKRGGMLSV